MPNCIANRTPDTLEVMTKAIIFDCFGVLVTESWLAFKDEYFGHDESLVREATDLMRQSDTGILTYEQFIEKVAAMAALDPKGVRTYLDKNQRNEPLLTYIATELKPTYKIGMLSNASMDWLGEMFTPEQLSLFEVKALSFETGVAKPDEQAYHSVAERLGVEPDECIFIDDQAGYCSAAKDVGMRAITYTSFSDFKQDLEKQLAEA